MSVGVPVTIWQPTSGNGEMGASGNVNITTLLGVLITTLSGVQLITDLSTYTPIPTSLWAENDAS
jgi:hypothetical protein